MSTPSPKSPEPSEKSKKYDRQLRLWGDHGQSCLESARVCLINATALGSEILKSLVLPGIGTFTIVDSATIQEEDIGCNFFVEVDNLGESRAQVTTQYLLELNPDVHGDYIDTSLDKLLIDTPEFFNSFSLIIATDVSEKHTILLSKKLWEMNIPLLICRSIGFVGYYRIQVKEHTIIEAHPDNEISDLRLDKPFPSLIEYMDGIDLDSMPLKEHSHTPYLIVLYKYLQKWQKESGKILPGNFKEKQQLRDLIRSGIRIDEQGVIIDEENFEEAIRAVNSNVSLTRIPSNVQEILNDNSCINLTQKSKPFWIMAKALNDFVNNEGNGCLPVRGSIPDMTADTASYINLQQIYHKQANADADIIYRRTQQLLHELGQPPDIITEQDVRLFCKHSHELTVVRGTCIADEYSAHPSILKNYTVNSLEAPDSLLIYYVMIRGIDRFRTEYNAYPGEFDDQVEPDIVKLKACLSKLLNEWGWSISKDDYVHEFCRYGGAELHTISAFLGSCVAQEAIKFITHQYKPVHNTFIYDAMSSNTATFIL
ncbi:NEDD8-activating enzyme E1 regulatory subunit [Chrysoperla carnea]|uniref:NEDD8-activating enzyme E1 regulatory subunit n=1 Tax=Chrysoperla carnea TaxID=189513 RepID=UPI001D064607|nr:NEDD8-activating enzyme E1 regulatory subunit [Chrysoperla carnea]